MDGPGGSSRSTSSTAPGISDGSAAISARCSGCLARVEPIQPISRPVVSLPAPASTVTYIRTSSRVSVRVTPFSSSNRAVSSSVMTSSEGCVSRQSMYSPNASKVRMASWLVSSLPSSPTRWASACSRKAAWPSSGMPRSMPMTRIGISRPSFSIRSNRDSPTSGSRQRTQYSRTSGSSSAIRRGENTRASSFRWMSWTGGSSMMRVPGGITMFALISSSMTPREEENVAVSVTARSTSAYRLSA